MKIIEIKIREVHEGVFVFKMLDVEQLAETIALWRHENEHYTVRPNSMNKYGVILGGMIKPYMQELQEIYVNTIAEKHYNLKLKSQPYAFVVDYEMRKQTSLAAHCDSSDVTLNVCLGKKWEGGTLVFYDRLGGPPKYELEHRVGQAVIHRGSHVHRAKSISAGSRTNLILWCAARKPR